jgi:hypothetical protein
MSVLSWNRPNRNSARWIRKTRYAFWAHSLASFVIRVAWMIPWPVLVEFFGGQNDSGTHFSQTLVI